ncbi:hypothetical protein F5148DRAFT_842205 [Russula earlei]|uniref:Uncharacterized protein n=1 Tax=Russula earlei TaxID=71964 RepID=A0ACC0UB87_9AGAM|nr:hypothetical protein F5148DRAFT_842205 [Russula earlei]
MLLPLPPPPQQPMLQPPPTYSPSADVPSYSVAPGPSERTLAATARSRRRTPSGVFVRSNNLISIALRGQEEDTELPSYGRHGMICGDVGLSCTQGIQSVYIKVEGQLHLASPEGSSADSMFFGVGHDLWSTRRSRRSADDDADDSSAESCPSMFPFEIVLPDTFTDNGGRRSYLPPSFDVPYSDAADIRAQCNYLLRVVVERKGHKLSLWKLHKKLIVPFAYHPRTRPPQPILSSPFPFLSTVKTLPEEWFQITSTMDSKANSDLEPIDCHLFIPVVQTFALADKIPFFLQLIAPSKSLQSFLYSTIPAHTNLKRSKSMAAETSAPPTVRVHLLRQIIIVLNGQLSIRKFSIGEGNLRSLPPGASPSMLRSRSLDSGLSTLDYEGEVRANSDITAGQFGISQLQVRDFITTYLAPPNPWASPLNIHQHSHPIRLATDRCTENVDNEAYTLS